MLPFRFEHNHIVVSLTLNDSPRELNFLFDTGADGMAIRKDVAEEIGLEIHRSNETNIVGGQMKIEISGGNTVHLSDDYSLKNQNIALFETISNFDGIIGLNIARNHIVKVDNQNNQLFLYSVGDYKFPQEGFPVDIRVPYAVALIPVTVDLMGNKPVQGNFVFDTGAEFNLIAFHQFVQKIEPLKIGFISEDYGSTVSMGLSTPTMMGKAQEIKIGSELVFKDIPVTLQISSFQSNSISFPDGSIGMGLLRNYNFTIDLLRKKIHLEPIDIN